MAIKKTQEKECWIFLKNNVESKEETEKYKSRLERVIKRLAEKANS